MRIAHVVYSLDVGGQERMIVALSQELMARGHHVLVVALKRGGALTAELKDATVVGLPNRVGGAPRNTVDIARELRDFRPDAVHTHNPAALLYGVPAALLCNVRRIVHTKHGASGYGRRGTRLARLVAQGVNHFVAVSKATAITAATVEHPRSERLRVIPNGVKLARFSRNETARTTVRRALGIPEHAFVVGSVGRVVVEKDYPLLVEAMTPLLGPDVHLVIVGGGREEAALQEAARRTHSTSIHLVGMQSQVEHYMSAFDLFALTSRTEGLPLVIPEAMSANLPVVCPDVGGLAEVVPAETGTIVKPRTAEAFTAAYRQYLLDPGMRHQKGAAAYRYAYDNFSVERMTDRYLALYAD